MNDYFTFFYVKHFELPMCMKCAIQINLPCLALQASLDYVDWDMFRASSSNVSEFTEVALSFVNTLTEQATETVTKTFSNQKPWVDRTIRDAVNHRTAAYNAGILSGNMSEYKASCYTLRRAVRAAKRRYRERIESHFQLNDSQRMWQGLKTICSSGNNSSVEVRADPLLAEELNTFYGRFECNGGATLPISVSGTADRAAIMLSPCQRMTFGGN